MLTVRFGIGKACEEAYSALGIAERQSGADFVMYDGETPVAIMHTHIDVSSEPALHIDFVKYADGVEEGDKKFFLHAMFFKFREGAPILIQAAPDDSLKPFGFEEVDGQMRLYSGEINLYYNCGGRSDG